MTVSPDSSAKSDEFKMADGLATADPAPIDIVALSTHLDVAAYLRTAVHPDLRILRPEEVTDPAAIRFAVAWDPAPEAFQPYSNLLAVSSIAAGVDAILACPSLPENVTVLRVRDTSQADMMAGFAVWNTVWHHRRMGDYLAAQAAGVWARSFRADPPSAVTVGILGFGLMGKACARAITAAGFPVLVARNSTRSEAEPAEEIEIVSGPGAIFEVAARSRILVNVLPLTPETRNILDRRLFARMPEGAALIHIGRGEHLVEADLLMALDAGHLSGASVDVLAQEPPAPDHPFWTHPKIILTPHKASSSSAAEALRQLALNLGALMDGQMPPGIVDRTAGY